MRGPISWTPRARPRMPTGPRRSFDAIDYAALVVQDAQLAVLDALDARAYADERAKVAAS